MAIGLVQKGSSVMGGHRKATSLTRDLFLGCIRLSGCGIVLQQHTHSMEALRSIRECAEPSWTEAPFQHWRRVPRSECAEKFVPMAALFHLGPCSSSQ